jgi:hypothetical protein
MDVDPLVSDAVLVAGQAETEVVVPDQESRSLTIRRRFAQLLDCPLIHLVPYDAKTGHTS